MQVLYVFYHPADSGAVSLTSENIDMTLGEFVYFICYFAHVVWMGKIPETPVTLSQRSL